MLLLLVTLVIPLKAASIIWTDLQSGLKEAIKNDKLIMVDVFAVWCHWCKVLDKETYQDAGVVAESKKFVNVKVDGEINSNFSRKYGVNGFPAILFITGEGDLVDKVNGFVPGPEMLRRMQEIQEKESKFKSLQSIISDKTQDTKLLTLLVEAYINRQRSDLAIPLLNQIIDIDKDNKNGFADKALLQLGVCKINSKEYKKGIKNLELFEVKYSKHPLMDRVFYFKGIAYYQLNKKALAQENFNVVVHNYPTSQFAAKAREYANFIGQEISQ